MTSVDVLTMKTSVHAWPHVAGILGDYNLVLSLTVLQDLSFDFSLFLHEPAEPYYRTTLAYRASRRNLFSDVGKGRQS